MTAQNTKRPPLDVAGEELAAMPIPERAELLMASIVAATLDGAEVLAVELGVWRVPADDGDPDRAPAGVILTAADGEPDHLPGTSPPSLLRPRRPLLLTPGALPAVLALVERALAALPGAVLDDDGVALLAEAGELVATLATGPDGRPFVTIGWRDGSGVAFVPVERAEALATVIHAAEVELARRHVVRMN